MKSKLDFEAARSLLPNAKDGAVPQVPTEKWLRDNYPTLFVLGGKEHSDRFRVTFSAKPGQTPFVHRMTGGCGNMKPEAWPVLQNAIDALRGFSPDGSPQPKAEGLCLHGGTRMLFKADPAIARPGVTEVFPAIASDCPGATVVGVVARHSKMYYTDFGLVVSAEPNADYLTIVHPEQKAIALLQENSDEPFDEPWVTEYLRCADICGELQDFDWNILLTAIGGGGVTRAEIELWCTLARAIGDPTKWRVLLVKGAGGSTDALADDEAFLRDNPNVHVCGSSTEEIRNAMKELGAVRMPK
jgi:hypothetical protein